MLKSKCPACQKEITLRGEPILGQRGNCAACQAAFEVVWLFPLELDGLAESESCIPDNDPEQKNISLRKRE